MFICIGPPGCGKTFIGVKIVQLLLSLSPELEKPILLLTYKNHALDEFLKHMLDFCDKDDLVRIGGRSKMPELESCNLQSIMKSMAASKLFSKNLSDEIRETRQSIEFTEGRIKSISLSFNSKSYLTKSSLINELTDEKLQSLILDVTWRESHSVYQVNDMKVAKSYIKNAIDDVSKRYGSLKKCLEWNSICQKDDQNAKLCQDIFTRALEAWLPDRQELWRLKELQAAFIRQDIETKSSDDEADDGDASSDKDSEDEDYINQLLEARMFSDKFFEEKEKKKSGLVLFPPTRRWGEKDILIEISDYPDNLVASPAIRMAENLWNLDKIRRWQFLYCILEERASRITETFYDLLNGLRYLKRCKQELEMSKKIGILSRKKIIGMTITGASINHDLLHAIGPNVVIVEEAAEILEPSLLAALTSSTEHLILIGDHKQLRPQVDTYELCRNFQFDVSMMERLIQSKFPFKSLRKQNRMRPEFSELLRDIYPNLEDNLPLVSIENEPLKCIGKSMFFWNHEDPEKKDRTYTNIKEAERIVALVIYLLRNGCCPSEITVLAAYLGQTKLLKKLCFEEITWDCTKLVYFNGVCEHQIEKKCYENESDVKCPVKPCGKLRSCGHPCNNTCGDDCDQGNCQYCQGIYKNKLKKFKKAAKKRVRHLEAKITKKDIPTFIVEEIHSTEPTAAEYMKVQDQVTKFIQPCHNWFPAITKIEKVTNLVLEKKFEEAKSRAFGDYIDTKFHGTSDEGVKGITENGFRLPDENLQDGKRGMFGQGIYFATDSSKSAQQIYTKGSGKLLLCQVILGKSKSVLAADNKLNKNKLRDQKYDSIFAPRGSAVKNDEFVIFDPDQALPQYVIHFSKSDNPLPPFPKLPTSTPFSVTNRKAKRTVDFHDPYEMYYSFAESHFRRMAFTKDRHISLPPEDAEISSIDIVINKVLERKFEATKRSFRTQGISDKEILAYHGTDPANVDSILKDNLQLAYAKRQVYGSGNYFSEFPSVSLKYGKGLLLCRILPGKEYVNSTLYVDIPQGYNSKKVRPQQDNSGASLANLSGEMVIIENSDQILPFFVIHRASCP